MKYLILLNRRFPYKYGEAFLENEIDEISPYFDKVLIFPSDMTSKDPVTRKIKSSNVKTFAFEKGSLKARNMSYLATGLFKPKDQNADSLRNKLYSGYFAAAAEKQAKEIWTALSEYSFDKNDQVILYSYWFFINAKAAVLLKKKLEKITNVRCVSRAHNFDIYEDKKYLPEREYLLANVDAVFPCSENGTQYIRNKYPRYAEKINTSYLGTYDKGMLMTEHSKVFRIVSCSRVAPEKRIGLMIQSLSHLRNSKIQFEWTHFGGGEGLEELRRSAEEKLDFMKVCLTGAISNQQVYENYRNGKFNLFMNTSSAEGLPVSIMESISFGLPVVATSAGGTGEIVIDGISGILEPVEVSPERLAEDILKIAKMSDGEYSALASSARELWENKFQASTNYKKFAETLLGLFC